MKFSGKHFRFYWEGIRLPLGIFLLWFIAALILSLTSVTLYFQIFGGLSGLVLQVILFGFVGYVFVCDHDCKVGQAATAGALTGVIAGFISAVFGILMLYLAPQVMDVAIQQVTSQGLPADVTKSMVDIMVWAGLVTGPIYGGLLGALIAWISSLIFRKKKQKR